MTAPPEDRWPDATRLAERLVGDTGDATRVVLMYGSRLLRTNPDRHSALDFVVIVDDYRSFYRRLADADQMHRPVGLMTRLAGLLAPNVIAYTPDEGAGGIAKCLVISKEHFATALGPTPPDHFVLGRMVQRIGTVWTADEGEAGWVDTVLSGAHARVLDWMAPYLDGPFDAAGLGRRLLEVCYSGEFRPESRGRAGRVFEAQADHFAEVLGPGLLAAEARGELERSTDGRFVLSTPASGEQRRRWARHFRRSKARTTMRWFKHMLTFANWLPYVVRKVERHTGREIHLTVLERRLPLIFLWPRAIHVLVTRPKRELKP